jgi:hypothetical protein
MTYIPAQPAMIHVPDWEEFKQITVVKKGLALNYGEFPGSLRTSEPPTRSDTGSFCRKAHQRLRTSRTITRQAPTRAMIPVRCSSLEPVTRQSTSWALKLR